MLFIRLAAERKEQQEQVKEAAVLSIETISTRRGDRHWPMGGGPPTEVGCGPRLRQWDCPHPGTGWSAGNYKMTLCPQQISSVEDETSWAAVCSLPF